jgi:hypothetical protein
VNTTQSENQTGPKIGSLENNSSKATNVEQTQTPSTKSPGFDAVIEIVGLLAVFLYKRR